MENGTGRDVGRGFQPRLDGGPERAALHRVSTLVAAALLSSAQITPPLTPPKPPQPQAQASSSSQPAIVRGHVVVADSGQPLRKAQVRAYLVEPPAGVAVGAMQARVDNGRPEPQRLGNASTNDLGEFRIFGLMPGQYYVQGTWRRFGGPADPTSPDRTGYPETFFPGTTTITEAQRFTIRAGQTLGDLVMALSPIKTSRIEGTIVDADGKPLASVVISIGKI